MDANSRSRKKPFWACCFGAPQVEDEQAVAQQQHQQSDKPLPLAAASITAHANATAAADASPDLVVYSTDQLQSAVPTALRETCKSTDQALMTPKHHPVVLPDMPHIRPLMAMSLNRPYTDPDWFAAMSALEKVQKVQQARALQQLRAHHPHSHRHSSVSAAADDDTEAWYDARSATMSDSSVAFISDAEREEVSRLAYEMEAQEHAQGQLTVSVVQELQPPTPSCVPNPPLLFAEKDWKYIPVNTKPFLFYWERDAQRSSPFPLPIDEQMKLNSLFQKTHQSIPGMWLREVGDQLLLHAQPTVLAIPGIVNYTEYYNKDQSPSSWTLRRDIRIGKTMGQMYMTTDGVLIFRVFTMGMFSKAIEWVGEDYTRLEDNGETIVTRQLCKIHADNSVGTQFLVGRKLGTQPPRRSSFGGH
ncbi:hypothetical protein COO60DRAFT_1699000 [Scenedesmus sp. NREL 46B-D3]|nr:hypothetical protein COO60DRAFT_1699000 [Scenedesmus sp. NREL 46B-D3]